MKQRRSTGKRLVTDQISLFAPGRARFRRARDHRGTAQPRKVMLLTFDDVTDLVSAQRSTAWADVARRIAHEIKNPLTPIQLLSRSASTREYGDSITKDRDIFEQCTDTIIRQCRISAGWSTSSQPSRACRSR